MKSRETKPIKDSRYKEFYRIDRMISKIFLPLIVLLLVFTSCDVVDSVSEDKAVIIPTDNTRNCTETHAYDADGNYLGSVPAHEVGKVKTTKSYFDDPQTETYVTFRTEKSIIARIVNGERGIIPQGCTDWGYYTRKVRLKEGYRTHSVKVRLRPPDYWEEPDDWD